MKLTPVKNRWEFLVTTADLLNGWSTGVALPLIRKDDECTLLLPYNGLNGATKTSDIFMNIPIGWRPDRMGNYGTLGYVSADSAPALVLKDFNRLSIRGTGRVSGILKWITGEAPPPPLLRKLFALAGWSR